MDGPWFSLETSGSIQNRGKYCWRKFRGFINSELAYFSCQKNQMKLAGSLKLQYLNTPDKYQWFRDRSEYHVVVNKHDEIMLLAGVTASSSKFSIEC